MSPEQAKGLPAVDARTDVYSLGATLYEALTGEIPFRGTPHLVVRQVVDEEPRPPRQLNDRIPPDLETICLKAMAKEPARRYPTAGEFAGDLRRFLAGEPIRARPVGRVERLWRWCRRKPVIAGLTAALSLALLLGGGGVVWQWRRAEASRQQEARQKTLAEQNYRRARQAVDEYLARVSDSPEFRDLGLEPVQKRLLEAARKFYEEFIAEQGETPELQVERAMAYHQLAQIDFLTAPGPEAIRTHQQAVARWEPLARATPPSVDALLNLAQMYSNLGVLYPRNGQPVPAGPGHPGPPGRWRDPLGGYGADEGSSPPQPGELVF